MGVSHWYEIIRHGSHWYEIIRHGSHWYEIIRHGSHWYGRIQHGRHWYGRILHGNEFTTRMSHSRIDKRSPGGAHLSGTSITTMEVVMVWHTYYERSHFSLLNDI